MNPLRVDHAPLGQLGIEGQHPGKNKGVWFEPRIDFDSLAGFAVYNRSFPAQLNLVWEGESALVAPVRERHDDVDITTGEVVFLSDKAGYLIGIESHEEADRSRQCVDFNDPMRGAVKLLAADISNDLLPSVVLPAESIPHEQLGIEQILLATNSGQAIRFHGTSRPRVQGYVRARDISFVTNHNFVETDGGGQRLQEGLVPGETHAVAGQVVDGDNGKV
ncbi:hypothetical protein ACFL5H_00180 [Candidatus Latescibacterota bacterium]